MNIYEPFHRSSWLSLSGTRPAGDELQLRQTRIVNSVFVGIVLVFVD